MGGGLSGWGKFLGLLTDTFTTMGVIWRGYWKEHNIDKVNKVVDSPSDVDDEQLLRAIRAKVAKRKKTS